MALRASAIAIALAAMGCGRSSSANADPHPIPQNEEANMHKVSVQFDYDFGKHPACTEKPAVKNCIKQFDVYDVSGQKFRLFSIPVPKDATGFVKGIAGTSPSRAFLPGTHYISVTAEDAQGSESQTSAARVKVEIKAKTVENGSGEQK